MTETVSLTEASRRTGISRRTLGRMIASGRLPGTRTDGGYEVPVEALDGLTSSTPEADTSTEEVAKLVEALAVKDRELDEALSDLRQLEVVREQEAEAAQVTIRELERSHADLDKRAAVAEAVLKERDSMKELIAELKEDRESLRELVVGLTALLSRPQVIDVTSSAPSEPYSEPKRGRFGRKRRGKQ